VGSLREGWQCWLCTSWGCGIAGPCTCCHISGLLLLLLVVLLVLLRQDPKVLRTPMSVCCEGSATQVDMTRTGGGKDSGAGVTATGVDARQHNLVMQGRYMQGGDWTLAIVVQTACLRFADLETPSLLKLLNSDLAACVSPRALMPSCTLGYSNQMVPPTPPPCRPV
jgi:hypothetical protein